MNQSVDDIVEDAPEYKVVIIGDLAVGKTSLIQRFSEHYFLQNHQPTIAASYLQIALEIREKTIKLNIWDTAGDERFHCVVPLYARTADAMIIVFDLSKPDTFPTAQKWYEELINTVGEVPVVILAGNKCDLVQNEDVTLYQNWATQCHLTFIETSALDGRNVDEMFYSIGSQLRDLDEKKIDSIHIIEPDEKNIRKKSKCNCK